MEEIINVKSRIKADIRFQDGGLPHAKGVHCIQVMRACNNPKTSTDHNGWTYNHAAMICYWNNEFYIDYLCNPVSEHVPPSKTMICWSKDSITWSKPVELFPIFMVPSVCYRGPSIDLMPKGVIMTVMHQRMSFYVSKSNRLLATGFYGITPDHSIAPNNGYGAGRVVREIYEDHTFSEVFFLRYNEPAGYTREVLSNTKHFSESKDKEFIKACEELLADKLVTAQMWEEERLQKEAFTQPGAEAFCYFTLPDNSVTVLYKKSLVCKSFDKGATYTDLKKEYSIETSTGKVWGERTDDGKYALSYNPTTDSAHRWPLAVTASEDGINFEQLFALTPEVSPLKYPGLYKNLGPQYVRGINEHNPKPNDNRMHLAYTVNKEDVWTCSVPLPITSYEENNINDTFEDIKAGQLPENWNIYSPVWSRVCMENISGNNMLALYDADPYDRCRALRIFCETKKIYLQTCIRINIINKSTEYTLDLEDISGRNAVRIVFLHNSSVVVKNGGRYDFFTNYEMEKNVIISIQADCRKNLFILNLEQGQKRVSRAFNFSNSVYKLQRVLYTSKRNLPFNTIEDCGKYGNNTPLKKADQSLPESCLLIDYLEVSKKDYEDE